ncbi:hypothetical protein ABEB36_012699 [Hypothenemus hampei]|uniref:Major facilitator superfamily (MFS) profile domain-containing protein n=1 Tax=Hypothenemus hampei TaxID=57062 RepID=A0ABD1EC39_HYPHA
MTNGCFILIQITSDASSSRNISTFRRYLAQILAVFIKNINLFIYGTTLGLPTILVPSLSGKDAIVLDEEGISWIASIINLCVPLGCLMSGAFSRKFGRIRSLQIVSVPYFLAFLTFHFSTEPWHIFFALCLVGTAGGLSESPALSYAVEVSEPNLRGVLTSTSTLFISLGILFSFILGSFYSWRTVALIIAVPPVASIFLLMVIPETPYWLISRNRLKKSQESLAWLRGWTNVENVDKEFMEIRKNVQNIPSNSLKSNLKMYFEGRFFKPYFLIILMFIFDHFGFTPISVYAVSLFDVFQIPINSYYATIFIGLANLLGSVICMLVLRFTGKRLLIFACLLGICINFILVGIYSFKMGIENLENGDIPGLTWTWVPLVCIMLLGFLSYMSTFSFPWILVGEIYYNEIRDVATGISAASGYLVSFLANKTFISLVNSIGLYGVFWFYGGVAIAGIITLYFLLPETEGKSLFDVAQHFNDGPKLNNKVLKSNR